MRSKTGNLKYYLFLFSIFVYLNSFSQSHYSFASVLPTVAGAKGVASDNSDFRKSLCFSFKAWYTSGSALASVADTIRKKDRDGDGIEDSLDKCPDEKGVIQYDGCPIPDSDNDGIADDVDDCPTIAGLLKYKGCPAPDSDGDKINDEDDFCPNEPGVARYGGCPVGDRDGDGVNDDDDKCIDVAGTLTNQGCPEGKANMSLPVIKKKKKK
jgi:hypothetical protein